MLDAHAQRLLRRLEWGLRRAPNVGLSGEYRSAFRGRGREFDQVVEYVYGDDVRDIDWNVTARLGIPYRKQFVEERELSVVLLFEDSPSLQFGSLARSKREVLLEVAAGIGLLSAGARDRVGLWHARPEAHSGRRPVGGRANVLKLTADLVASPAPELGDGGRVDVAWPSLLGAFPRRTLVVWLGDFPPRESPPEWQSIRRRYQVVGLRADDPWEQELPDSPPISVLDPHHGKLLRFSPRSPGTRRAHRRWQQDREASWQALFPAATDRAVIRTDEDPIRGLSRFLRARMLGSRG